MYKYQQPRKGIFSVEDPSKEYDEDGDGWPKKEEEYLIIGEDDTSYIYEFRYDEGYYSDYRDGTREVHCWPNTWGLGIHKSRLVRWVATQQTLFN